MNVEKIDAKLYCKASMHFASKKASEGSNSLHKASSLSTNLISLLRTQLGDGFFARLPFHENVVTCSQVANHNQAKPHNTLLPFFENVAKGLVEQRKQMATPIFFRFFVVVKLFLAYLFSSRFSNL